MSDSPIERFLDAVDRLDVDAALALMTPDARVLVADGRRAEGTEAVRQLLGDFLGQLRSTTHMITAQWHQADVWIAEVDASYVLRDWLEPAAASIRRARETGWRVGVEGVRRTRTSALGASDGREGKVGRRTVDTAAVAAP